MTECLSVMSPKYLKYKENVIKNTINKLHFESNLKITIIVCLELNGVQFGEEVLLPFLMTISISISR